MADAATADASMMHDGMADDSMGDKKSLWHTINHTEPFATLHKVLTVGMIAMLIAMPGGILAKTGLAFIPSALASIGQWGLGIAQSFGFLGGVTMPPGLAESLLPAGHEVMAPTGAESHVATPPTAGMEHAAAPDAGGNGLSSAPDLGAAWEQTMKTMSPDLQTQFTSHPGLSEKFMSLAENVRGKLISNWPSMKENGIDFSQTVEQLCLQ